MEKRWSREQLAEKAGVEPQTIKRWEKQLHEGNLVKAVQTARALGASLDEMTGIVPPRPLPPCFLPEVGVAAGSTRLEGKAVPSEDPLDLTGCEVWRVVDDSMEPIIRSGERVIVDRRKQPRHGNIVVAELESETEDSPGYVVKQLIECQDGTIQLRSINMRQACETIVREKRPTMWRVIGMTVNLD